MANVKSAIGKIYICNRQIFYFPAGNLLPSAYASMPAVFTAAQACCQFLPACKMQRNTRREPAKKKPLVAFSSIKKYYNSIIVQRM